MEMTASEKRQAREQHRFDTKQVEKLARTKGRCGHIPETLWAIIRTLRYGSDVVIRLDRRIDYKLLGLHGQDPFIEPLGALEYVDLDDLDVVHAGFTRHCPFGTYEAELGGNPIQFTVKAR